MVCNGGVSTTTKIATLKTQLETYVAQITDDLANARADLALEIYIDAYTAYINVVSSAATAYNNVAGGVTKRQVDEARASADGAYSDFKDACLEGGVIIPGVNDSLGMWSINSCV